MEIIQFLPKGNYELEKAHHLLNQGYIFIAYCEKELSNIYERTLHMTLEAQRRIGKELGKKIHTNPEEFPFRV